MRPDRLLGTRLARMPTGGHRAAVGHRPVGGVTAGNENGGALVTTITERKESWFMGVEWRARGLFVPSVKSRDGRRPTLPRQRRSWLRAPASTQIPRAPAVGP